MSVRPVAIGLLLCEHALLIVGGETIAQKRFSIIPKESKS